MDGLELGLTSPGDDPGEAGDDRQDVLDPVGGVVLESGGPHRGQARPRLLESQAQVERGAGQEGGRDVSQGVLGQGELHQVLGQGVLEDIHVTYNKHRVNITNNVCQDYITEGALCVDKKN